MTDTTRDLTSPSRVARGQNNIEVFEKRKHDRESDGTSAIFMPRLLLGTGLIIPPHSVSLTSMVVHQGVPGP